MADTVSNIAKGRAGEWFHRVNDSDPTNAVLVVVAVVSTDTDADFKDFDNLSLILADANTAEATNTNYARIVLDDTDIGALAPDDTNDRYDYDIPDPAWTAVAAGSNWTHLILCYDSDSTGGDDTNILPIGWVDFTVTPDGSDITATVDAAGIFRAA